LSYERGCRNSLRHPVMAPYQAEGTGRTVTERHRLL